MIQPDPVRLANKVQREAARPDTSVALRASAGSGKTRVLIDRFVRLCVEGSHNDTHPRSILAITFTRKAATEIRERLLERTRRMALADEEKRAAELADLFSGRDDPAPLPQEVDRAARLYEKLLEDTGGLQVGTIHSFCQRILARFATEAGMDPHARLVEDREDLLDETLDRLEVMMAADSALGELAGDVGATPAAVRKAMRDVFAQQVRVERWVRRAASRAGTEPKPRRDLLPALLAEVRAFLFPGQEVPENLQSADFMPDLAAALEDFSTRGMPGVGADLGAEVADRVSKGLVKLETLTTRARASLDDGDPDQTIALAREILLTKGGTVRAFTLVRDDEIKAAMKEAVLEGAKPLLEALRRLDLVALYRRNRAQLTLGLRALDILDGFKQRDRVLDFGDLEDMACILMGDRARALSLLFRLEDSIRHIMVDEYQDTNFNQQDILTPFVNEFLGGGGAEGATPATVFLVGDMKQSIYGFRGAEPAIFAGAISAFRKADLPTPTLPTNFRSLEAVVDGVGGMFGAEPLASNLPEGEAGHVHQAFARREDAGVFVLRRAYEEAADGRTADQVAADEAARLVRELVDGGAITWEGFAPPEPRPLEWRDILILYRSRTGVSLYEQAFRAAGIPIEPAGRGMLAAGREVQDILALLRWLVWPDDDVALAAVLRSPLFRVAEKDIQEVLAERGLFRPGPDGPEGRPLPPRTLWWALREKTEGPLAEASALLAGWRADTGLVTIHELLRRIYREGQVLARYEATGEPQARVNLERLYDLALGPEVAGTPTVRHFIDLVDKAGRRGGQDEGTAPESGGAGRVRFMTIHGAKGLEAPVVLLIDADRALSDKGAEVRLNPDDDTSGLVFGADKSVRRGIEGAEDYLDPDLLQAAAAEAATGASIEENNLLYVALTRARDRLYLIGGKSSAKDDDLKTFLSRSREAVGSSCGPAVCEDHGGDFQPETPVRVEPTAEGGGPVIRVWQPPAMGERLRTILPSSDLGSPPVPPGGPLAPPDPDLSPRDYGTLVHRLLELAAESGSRPTGESPAHREAGAVFSNPDLAWVFDRQAHENAQSEAPIIHRIRPGGPDSVEERVTGVIDRLVLRSGRVDVIDYKTNRLGDDPAYREALIAHYRPQMEAYRAAAGALFPDREVHAWLLFTEPLLEGENGLFEIA